MAIRTIVYCLFAMMFSLKAYSNESDFNIEDNVLIKYIGKDSHVVIPEHVRSIAPFAFSDNSYVQVVKVHSLVEDIQRSAFRGKYLASIEVDSRNGNYSSLDGVLYNKKKTLLITYPIYKDIMHFKIPPSVTEIGVEAFWGCYAFTIDIPESVVIISGYAFQNCLYLERIKLPSKLHTLGDNAFYNCISLESVNIPTSLTHIRQRTFGDCRALRFIDVERITPYELYDYEVSVFHSNAFKNAMLKVPHGSVDKYKSANIWSNFELISSDNFIIKDSILHKYYGLDKEIIIPDTVVGIDKDAFNYFYLFESVYIPASVSNIEANALRSLPMLQTIKVNKDNIYYTTEENVLYNKDKTSLLQYPICREGTIFSIPSSVIHIGHSAFGHCKLTKIDIPNSVKTIDSRAFFYAKSLVSIEIPEGVEHINNETFENCIELKSIILPNSLKSIDNSAFRYCKSLNDINLPENLEIIGEVAFSSCPLLNISVPNSVKKIDHSAFSYCELLENIILPNQLDTLSRSIFFGCKNLKSVDIPSTVKYIGSFAFYNCHSLENIVIPEGVDKISKETFYDCNNLKSISIPTTVKTIDELAFFNCCSLDNIILPDNLTEIGVETFYFCKKLLSLHIPVSLAKIGDDAFGGCYLLEEFTVDSNSKHFVAKNGVLYNEDMRMLIKYPTNKSGSYFKIPISVNKIGLIAFSETKLDSISIPSTVTEFEELAFYNNLNLRKVFVEWDKPIDLCSFEYDLFNFNQYRYTLIVPAGTKDAYSNACMWEDFGEIKERQTVSIRNESLYEISATIVDSRLVIENAEGYSLNLYNLSGEKLFSKANLNIFEQIEIKESFGNQVFIISIEGVKGAVRKKLYAK